MSIGLIEIFSTPTCIEQALIHLVQAFAAAKKKKQNKKKFDESSD